jgi:hypothetical protein
VIKYPQECYRCGCIINTYEETGQITLTTPLKYYCIECREREQAK